jgi:hypothetical protein
MQMNKHLPVPVASPRGKELPLTKRMVGHQSRAELFGVEKDLLSLSGIETRYSVVQHVAYSLH